VRYQTALHSDWLPFYSDVSTEPQARGNSRVACLYDDAASAFRLHDDSSRRVGADRDRPLVPDARARVQVLRHLSHEADGPLAFGGVVGVSHAMAEQLAALAARHALPAIYQFRVFAADGV
jgi:hypothetical protein